MVRLQRDFVHLYMDECKARIVAKSGKPSDRFHIGKVLLQALSDDTDFIAQIDGGLGKSETTGSVLKRSIQCAEAMRKRGLKIRDVVTIMSPNHLDVCIAMYASLYIGAIVSTVDKNSGIYELMAIFKDSRPKLVFCMKENENIVKEALERNNLTHSAVIFDDDDNNLETFLATYNGDTSVKNFKPAEIDPEETISFLVATSGSTGLPKNSITTHKGLMIYLPYMLNCYENFPKPCNSILVLSTLQWLTAIMGYLSTPIFRITRVQTSLNTTKDHTYELINKYKPNFSVLNPPFLNSLVMASDRDRCDFSCFEILMVGGSAINKDLIEEMQIVSPKTKLVAGYGMSEIGISHLSSDYSSNLLDLVPIATTVCKLVDPVTGKDVTEPNVPGELWTKGPSVFKGYYNNKGATKEAFSDDGWLKSGDLLSRNENNFYTYVERLKMLLKYKNNQISPVQIEAVIHEHPGVMEVAVSGAPHPRDGDLVAAFVITRPGHSVTEDEIRELVKNNLSDANQLRGGVFFVDSLPLTPSTKVDRKKVKQMAIEMVTQ